MAPRWLVVLDCCRAEHWFTLGLGQRRLPQEPANASVGWVVAAGWVAA